MRRSVAVLRSSLALTAALGCAAMLAACSGHKDYSYEAAKDIRDNATPDLDTLAQRPVDVDNAIAVTFDTNGRLFNEDLGRMFFFDRPSRLTPTPMPH